ncbi:MAG: hypothetical protein KDC73_05755 [Ignavibacteriae bacterium]|nr:hypothetical protein [Ignavibacteriota bacterium]MCB9243769.1 hypothetical protein [Ignavibacteriales bacterium]
MIFWFFCIKAKELAVRRKTPKAQEGATQKRNTGLLGEFTPMPCLFGTFVARQKYTPSGAKTPEAAKRLNTKKVYIRI